MAALEESWAECKPPTDSEDVTTRSSNSETEEEADLVFSIDTEYARTSYNSKYFMMSTSINKEINPDPGKLLWKSVTTTGLELFSHLLLTCQKSCDLLRNGISTAISSSSKTLNNILRKTIEVTAARKRTKEGFRSRLICSSNSPRASTSELGIHTKSQQFKDFKKLVNFNDPLDPLYVTDGEKECMSLLLYWMHYYLKAPVIDVYNITFVEDNSDAHSTICSVESTKHYGQDSTFPSIEVREAVKMKENQHNEPSTEQCQSNASSHVRDQQTPTYIPSFRADSSVKPVENRSAKINYSHRLDSSDESTTMAVVDPTYCDDLSESTFAILDKIMKKSKVVEKYSKNIETISMKNEIKNTFTAKKDDNTLLKKRAKYSDIPVKYFSSTDNVNSTKEKSATVELSGNSQRTVVEREIRREGKPVTIVDSRSGEFVETWIHGQQVERSSSFFNTTGDDKSEQQSNPKSSKNEYLTSETSAGKASCDRVFTFSMSNREETFNKENGNTSLTTECKLLTIPGTEQSRLTGSSVDTISQTRKSVNVANGAAVKSNFISSSTEKLPQPPYSVQESTSKSKSLENTPSETNVTNNEHLNPDSTRNIHSQKTCNAGNSPGDKSAYCSCCKCPGGETPKPTEPNQEGDVWYDYSSTPMPKNSFTVLSSPFFTEWGYYDIDRDHPMAKYFPQPELEYDSLECVVVRNLRYGGNLYPFSTITTPNKNKMRCKLLCNYYQDLKEQQKVQAMKNCVGMWHPSRKGYGEPNPEFSSLERLLNLKIISFKRTGHHWALEDSSTNTDETTTDSSARKTLSFIRKSIPPLRLLSEDVDIDKLHHWINLYQENTELVADLKKISVLVSSFTKFSSDLKIRIEGKSKDTEAQEFSDDPKTHSKTTINEYSVTKVKEEVIQETQSFLIDKLGEINELIQRQIREQEKLERTRSNSEMSFKKKLDLIASLLQSDLSNIKTTIKEIEAGEMGLKKRDALISERSSNLNHFLSQERTTRSSQFITKRTKGTDEANT